RSKDEAVFVAFEVWDRFRAPSFDAVSRPNGAPADGDRDARKSRMDRIHRYRDRRWNSVLEHRLVTPHDLSRVNVAFFNLNGYISILLLLTFAGDILIK